MSEVADALSRLRGFFAGPTMVWGPGAADAVRIREKLGARIEADDAAVAPSPSPWPVPADGDQDVVIVLPKARAAVLMAARAASAAPAGTRLWAIGPNKGGAASAGKQLSDAWDAVAKAESVSHCVLWKGRARGVAFDPSGLFGETSVDVGTARIELATAPGVFASGQVDDGTRMLLAHAKLPAKGRFIDIGCGSGVIAAWAALNAHAASIVATDTSALAVETARRTLALNGAAGVCLVADAWNGVEGRFERILSNPPFHEGRNVDLGDALRFIDGAADHLAEAGELWLVANRFLPYVEPLTKRFASVGVAAEDGRFRVYVARGPQRSARP